MLPMLLHTSPLNIIILDLASLLFLTCSSGLQEPVSDSRCSPPVPTYQGVVSSQ
jgi:hypothetical protein